LRGLATVARVDDAKDIRDKAEAQGMNAVLLYDAACQALARAKATDEVREIRDRAQALRAYARQAKNRRLELDATEIRIRAERRIGELMAAQRDGVGLNVGARGNPGGRGAPIVRAADGPAHPTLADASIDKHLADQARRLAALPAEEFEALLATGRERVEQKRARLALDLIGIGREHFRTIGTGEVEWYTPSKYVEAARQVLGEIDLDPASSEVAQQVVQARHYWTVADDALAQPRWNGRVFLNPPYVHPALSRFVERLVAEVQAGHVTAAILLTHNNTDTTWFHLAGAAASALCFPRGRIAFIDPHGDRCAPVQGQCFFYFGPDSRAFHRHFQAIGLILWP